VGPVQVALSGFVGAPHRNLERTGPMPEMWYAYGETSAAVSDLGLKNWKEGGILDAF
jgi:hypothetical protein